MAGVTASKGRKNFRKPPFLPRPILPPRHDRGVGASARSAQGNEDGGNIMLRIRTGARHGLRWGMFGFVAAVFIIPSHASQAAPYADIVVDANSGAVLHSTNPDAKRHPASLTKIMTLYLLFEQLESGKLKLDSPLKVSSDAAEQAPTKLGLKPGSTLAVENAIKGMVTRSANDAAVVVAEAIAGDEREFAKLMTRTAHALGMSNTVYRNASGLPDDDQVTTARDQALLGRAVQERFPRYYKYFSIRSFTFRGESIGNHNHLLGRVEGVDGIKTGYIRASGFNLVTSVHRGNRYLVAVVMGGSSAGSRDARMRELIQDKIAQASTKRTAPMVAEAPVAAETKPAPKVAAKSEPKPELKSESKVASMVERKTDTKAEGKSAPRFAVASAISVPIRFKPAPAQAEPAVAHSQTTAGAGARVVAGSTDPIRPVLVKTLTVRAGAQMASLAPLHVSPSPVADVQPARDTAHIPVAAPAVAISSEPPAPPVVKPEPPAPSPAVAAAKPEVPATQPAPV
ncbi:MAG: serine hydrolase, partial [Xanthobacteraceae bacterium]